MKIILTAIIVFVFFNANAQEKFLDNPENARKLSIKTTQLFKENKVTAFFENIKQYWPLPENEINSLESQTIKSLNIVEERFGQSIGIEKIKEETIKDFAIRETYIIRYENHAIRLIYTYYKNNNGWILNSFKWDDSYFEEFK